jgi:hypothetical protein
MQNGTRAVRWSARSRVIARHTVDACWVVECRQPVDWSRVRAASLRSACSDGCQRVSLALTPLNRCLRGAATKLAVQSIWELSLLESLRISVTVHSGVFR